MPRKVKLFAAGLLLAVIGIACVAMAGKSAHAEWDRTYMAYDGNSWSMSEEGVLKIESDEGWLDYLKYSITDYSISFVPEEINELVIGKDVTNLRMYNLPYELPTTDFLVKRIYSDTMQMGNHFTIIQYRSIFCLVRLQSKRAMLYSV